MNQMKSSNTNSTWGGLSALRRVFSLSIPATMVLSAALAVIVAVAIDGCSQKQAKQSPNPSGQNLAQSTPPAPAQAEPSPAPSPTPAKKKVVVKRPATVTYKDSTYGVSFRYPLKSTRLTAEKAERLPMNFAEPGGVTVTSLELPGSAASSLFHVSVKKGLTQEQCGKFALADPVQGSDAPIQNDDELGPTKVSVRGTEFVKAETVSDELDARYYHHFEPGQSGDGKTDAVPGTCYEFALGVLDNPENTKQVDEVALFEKLERIFHTVTIKQPQTPAAVTASTPSVTVSASNPQ
ncbi:MAG TPA: hypothetical protein VF532_16015 [Candidatus Angelobacter sp.]